MPENYPCYPESLLIHIPPIRCAAQKAQEALQSRAVDPGELAARLLQFAGGQEGLPGSPQQTSSLHAEIHREASPTSTRSGDPDEWCKESETKAHTRLVAEGGRPCYPISELEHVFQNPGDHREILRHWHQYLEVPDNPDDSNMDWLDWQVFQTQLTRWREFRKWQRDNRRIHDPDQEGFPAYVEKENQGHADSGVTWNWAWPNKTEEQYLELLKKYWEEEQRKRECDREVIREVRGDTGFPEYAEAVKQRLARHGFTQPFHLAEKPQHQTKLATWIEYLNFEYWWADRYTREINRNLPKREAAWKHLADLGVVRPNETPESIRSQESAVELSREHDGAKQAVASAEAAARAALQEAEKAKHGRSRFTAEERAQRLTSAKLRLDAAQKALEVIKKRVDLTIAFTHEQTSFRYAQAQEYRHTAMAEWILDQIPLVSEEESLAQHRPDHLDEVKDTTKAKQKHPRTSSTPDDMGTPSTGPNLRQRARRNDPTNDELPSKRRRNNPPPVVAEALPAPRRSARIAAKRAAAPPTPKMPPPSSSPRKIRKTPTPKVVPSKPDDHRPKSNGRRAATRAPADGPGPKRRLRKRKAG